MLQAFQPTSIRLLTLATALKDLAKVGMPKGYAALHPAKALANGAYLPRLLRLLVGLRAVGRTP